MFTYHPVKRKSKFKSLSKHHKKKKKIQIIILMG